MVIEYIPLDTSLHCNPGQQQRKTINNKYLHLVHIVNFWLNIFMDSNWGVKSVPAGGWSITGTTKLDRVSHTSNFHSWDPQDTNQVLCNKKALQYVTKKNYDNSLSGLQLFNEEQARTKSKAGLSGDLAIPVQPNTNVKQIQHISKPKKNSWISCLPKKLW